MLRGDVDAAVEPADRPAVEVEAVEHGLVAQRGKELVLLDERQAVEDALAAVVKGQVQPVAVKCAGGCDPFQNVAIMAMILTFGRASQLVLLSLLPLHRIIDNVLKVRC